MAELEIRLQIDPVTGKKNLILSYESDSDALPMEHEEEHRRLVNRLIEGGSISASELGELIIEREGAGVVAEPQEEHAPLEEREAIDETGSSSGK